MATRAAFIFERKFKPKWEDINREPIEDARFEAEIAKIRHVWTCVDPMVKNGMHFWVPGFHRVNAVGYIYTEVPWNDWDLDDEYRRW